MIEDLYSENLVDTPDDIERVIEGEDGIQHGSGRESGDENKQNEGEDKENNEGKDKTTKVRRKLGPRVVLNAERLNGPRGIGSIEEFFSDINLQGKGKEKEDLELVMKRMEHWAHRLAPRMQFDDCLKKIEKLGSKKEISNRVKRIRLGMDYNDVVRDDDELEAPDSPPHTTADETFDLLMSSSVPAAPLNVEITDEQREQMLRNRLIAEERRAARIKKAEEMKQLFLEKQRTSNSQQCSEATPVSGKGMVGEETTESGQVETGSEIPEAELGAANHLNNTQHSEGKHDEYHDAEFEANIAAMEMEMNRNQEYVEMEQEEEKVAHKESESISQHSSVEGNERATENMEDQGEPIEGDCHREKNCLGKILQSELVLNNDIGEESRSEQLEEPVKMDES